MMPFAGKNGPSRSRRSRRAWLRYRFDLTLARGPLVVIIYLAVLTGLLILLTATIAAALHIAFGDGPSNSGFAEQVWQTVLRTLDPGTFASDLGWPSRLLALTITLTGIFLAGSLIGLIAHAVDQQVEQLRKGRSPVIESGHILLLGWSPQVPLIISELVLANASESRSVIVVLSDQDQQVADALIRSVVGDIKTPRIVFRTGDPTNPDDLVMCALADARSIVVLRSDRGDAEVIRTVLAINVVDRSLDVHQVVAELESDEYGDIVSSISHGHVVTVSKERMVAELAAQACLHAGIASVFKELIGFEGDEIYFTPAGSLAESTYRQALLAFDACSVMGRIAPDGTVELNLNMDGKIAPDDRIILIAEDDSTIGIAAKRPDVMHLGDASRPQVGPKPLTVAIVGWSTFGASIVREIDEFLPPGSRLDIYIDPTLVAPERVDVLDLANVSVEVTRTSGPSISSDGYQAIGEADQILVLAYRDLLDDAEADARTLLSMMMLRSAFPESGPGVKRIVAELVDQQNVRLAGPLGVDDLIVSDALAALVIAQLAERSELLEIFRELFDPNGAALELIPADCLVPTGTHSYADVVFTASSGGVSVLGYRCAATQEIHLNPKKQSVITLVPGDELIALTTRSV